MVHWKWGCGWAGRKSPVIPSLDSQSPLDWRYLVMGIRATVAIAAMPPTAVAEAALRTPVRLAAVTELVMKLRIVVKSLYLRLL